ncbi:hypothetical protein RclHR1_30080001 [Rhizophagus clarus]|uniref:Uncharacterized protein n=1 Tax=Rhizophagus clarus TaxID=94130 RepID=A0A2Z6R5B9_9GLOM|nr:hypothetical protein RclHR1_30080001 [Rhizophagus clarus]GES96324.1 hypothetical protein GLOIN_2v1769754 [Rhizophagus clarus]
MIGEYTCNYLLRTGFVCGRTCRRPDGCFEHWKARAHFPCRVCGKPTSSEPVLCRKHANSYYVTQYINRLRDRAFGGTVQELGNQIAQENLFHSLTYEQLINKYHDRLIKLNISLCRECFIPIGKEKGEYCNECVPL